MSDSVEQRGTPPDENLTLGSRARPLVNILMMVGFAGIILTMIQAFRTRGDDQRWLYSYLTAFAFCMSLGIGGLFFVLLQHVTKAGWSVAVRRVAESLAATLPLVGVFALPILASVVSGDGNLYVWAQSKDHLAAPENDATAMAATAPVAAADVNMPAMLSVGIVAGPATLPVSEQGSASVDTERQSRANAGAGDMATPSDRKVLDELTWSKRNWLNPGFFVIRVIFYFAVWTLLAFWFRNRSIEQDGSGDPKLSLLMQKRSAPAMIAFALTLTLAAFDFLMSLDPHWYSTIFGVYYFAGCAISMSAVIVITVNLLQSNGYLQKSVTVAHFHDLGKLLFAFTFFWGYIGFSQFMLIWYANIPEETQWLRRHGATTVAADTSIFSGLILVLLFGHLLIPFAGLLSRHVKRSRMGLFFWAVWMLSFHYLDLYWLVVPEYQGRGGQYFSLMDVTALVGLLGLFLAYFVHVLSTAPLRPLKDPRLSESVAFENV